MKNVNTTTTSRRLSAELARLTAENMALRHAHAHHRHVIDWYCATEERLIREHKPFAIVDWFPVPSSNPAVYPPAVAVLQLGVTHA